MFAEALETVKCLDEGVIESVADANIGSIFGIGFPAWTGGVLQYINQYGDPRATATPAAGRLRRAGAGAGRSYGRALRAAGLAGGAGRAQRAVPGRGCRSGLRWLRSVHAGRRRVRGVRCIRRLRGKGVAWLRRRSRRLAAGVAPVRHAPNFTCVGLGRPYAGHRCSTRESV